MLLVHSHFYQTTKFVFNGTSRHRPEKLWNLRVFSYLPYKSAKASSSQVIFPFMIDLTLTSSNCSFGHHNHHINCGRPDSGNQAAEALRLQALALFGSTDLRLSSSFQQN